MATTKLSDEMATLVRKDIAEARDLWVLGEVTGVYAFSRAACAKWKALGDVAYELGFNLADYEV